LCGAENGEKPKPSQSSKKIGPSEGKNGVKPEKHGVKPEKHGVKPEKLAQPLARALI
jgi:hypothetical protein|tara:strand:- start:6187 stop:6357 length:171 start_codon:yes stop_codon:yes gene_type:complete